VPQNILLYLFAGNWPTTTGEGKVRKLRNAFEIRSHTTHSAELGQWKVFIWSKILSYLIID